MIDLFHNICNRNFISQCPTEVGFLNRHEIEKKKYRHGLILTWFREAIKGIAN